MTPTMIELSSHADGANFTALTCDSAAPCRGTVVILHEIFGLDSNMRADATRWVEPGFDVIAPSLLDRIEPGFRSDHSEEGVAKSLAAIGATPDDQALGDIAACLQWATNRARGPVFVVGYCYGGRLAWRAACELVGFAGVSVYYGKVTQHLDLTPRCPVICHFGAKDPYLPGYSEAEKIAALFPALPVHVYAASGHGFNNADAADADPADAVLARERTIAFFGAVG